MSPKRIAVIGGGISGLSAAYFIQQQAGDTPIELTLFESKPRLGGVIQTVKHDHALMECGPDAFLTEKPQAVELCRRLGLEDQIIGTSPEHRRSFVVKDNRLIPVPSGWFMIAPKDLPTLWKTEMFSWPGKLRMAMELLIPKYRGMEDESVGSFVRRRFGNEALDRIGQPMIGGIYSADPDRLSILATFPRLRLMEKQHGSVIRALWKSARKKKKSTEASGPRYGLFATLKGGAASLIQALERELTDKGAAIVHRGVSRIECIDTETWRVLFENESSENFDAVCLAVPAPNAARLTEQSLPHLADLLGGIHYASAATVNLVLRRDQVKHPLNGFGFVVPSVEGRNIVGCSFSSVKFPHRSDDEHVLIRAFVGGAFHEKVLNLSDEAMLEAVCRDLRDLIGLTDAPQHAEITRWPQAMPQYSVDHLKQLRRIEDVTKQVKGLYLTGNAYKGIGIPDCIRQAEETASALWQYAANKSDANHQTG